MMVSKSFNFLGGIVLLVVLIENRKLQVFGMGYVVASSIDPWKKSTGYGRVW
jgi:hypothetical protein